MQCLSPGRRNALPTLLELDRPQPTASLERKARELLFVTMGPPVVLGLEKDLLP